jgi:hypothetical protein
MLKPEVAAERLKELKADGWFDRRLSLLERGPEKLRSTVRSLFGRDAAGKELPWEKRNKAQEEARAQFAKMPAGERAKAFDALFGDLAPYVAAGWDSFGRLSYEMGYERKPFRIPGGGPELDARRAQWVANLAQSLEGYAGHQTIEWVAAWAPYLGYNHDNLGILLAAAIDAGGEPAGRVMDVLKDSATNQHEVGQMGRHVTRALLTCNNREAWEFVEKLLLAAQRQEGLRQAILETIDEAHPDAFRRIVRVILENDLARFAATVRAVDVWFGLQWDAVSTKVVNATLEKTLAYLDDEAARRKAMDGDDAEQAFLALWAVAFEDARAAVPLAAKMLKDRKPEKRFVAAHALYMFGLDEAKAAAVPALDDEDLRVVARAIDCFTRGGDLPEALQKKSDLFERLEKLFARAPEKPTPMKAIVWPWWKPRLSKAEVAGAMELALGNRPVTRLVPYLEEMPGYSKAHVVKRLAEAKKYDAPTRELFLRLVADNYCREEAISGLRKCRMTDAEAQQVERLLTRKSGDVRRGVVGLLESQADPAVLASADRLLAAKDALQREAGLEMLRRLVDAKRLVEEARRRARDFQGRAKKVTKDETVHLEAILDEARVAETLDDALGLLDPALRTAPLEPKKKAVAFCTPAARRILLALDDLIHQHREEKVFLPDYAAELDEEDDEDAAEKTPGDDKPATAAKPKGKEELLGNVRWNFPVPRAALPLERDLQRLPMREVWEKWWSQRPDTLRDDDGMEVIRALFLKAFTTDGDGDLVDSDADLDEDEEGKFTYRDKLYRHMLNGVKPLKARYARVLADLSGWLLRIDPPKAATDFLLDGFETAMAMVPRDKLAEKEKLWNDEETVAASWREGAPIEVWRGVVETHRAFCPAEWTPQHQVRYYRLMRWRDEPTGNTSGLQAPRGRADWEILAAAYKARRATDADVYDHLLGPREQRRYGANSFDDLHEFTKAKPPKELRDLPELTEIVRRCRERVLEVELKRGDSPTAATDAARALSCSGGLDALVRVLEALADDKLQRGTRWGDQGKPGVFAHLIRTSLPAEGDTPEAFAARVKTAGISEDRLVEVAVYAPQWAAHVQHALGWDGFEESVWWLHAHTRDPQWGVEDVVKGKWAAAIGQRTPLAPKDLLDGAVDVAWFHRAHETLGAKRWDAIYEAAKYASGGAGHKRAQLFADAMLGKEKRQELIQRVRAKRYQDAVRALGLLPLAMTKGVLTDAGRKDLHERYKVLAEFLRTSRQFGSMRQASEKRATAIGMENLARSAGYPDPIRLQWAMEAEETKDLAKGPVSAKVGDVTVTLSIDEDGRPDVQALNTKTKRVLASVPPAAKKDKKVAELLARRTDLRRTASRVRQSLEQAMCRGDVFSAAELRELFANPMLSPLLARVVFTGEGVLGYPVDGGRGVADFAGKIEPLKKGERLRIAHPVDLLATKKWDKWQHDCFARERVQPFKQVFRELYTLTKTERDEADASRRYAGHQVNPRQAVSLLTTRGWLVAPEQGVSRTFHELGLTAWLSFQESFNTPAEVEGLTLEGVHFTQRGKWAAVALASIDPRVFSEVMRDVDLVVSVAHRGGVDPEASASTVQMRAALVRETCDLLKLTNVRLKDNHALVKGDLADYTVHLGSAVTHRQPGGALHIVAVHSQHRGRLFLPFADDDPRTAEVVSKVLLLARDKEIQDPNLLAQIRGRDR